MLARIGSVLSIVNFIGLIVVALYFLRSEKVFYVDSTRLINGYKGMADARTAYQQKTQVWKANIDTLVGELQSEIRKFERESPGMTSRERDLAKQLIQTKQKQAGDYQKATSEKASQEDSEMTRKVIEEINAYIKEYGEANNCKVIFAATEYGNIAFAEEGMDITDTILQGLNNRYTGVK